MDREDMSILGTVVGICIVIISLIFGIHQYKEYLDEQIVITQDINYWGGEYNLYTRVARGDDYGQIYSSTKTLTEIESDSVIDLKCIEYELAEIALEKYNNTQDSLDLIEEKIDNRIEEINNYECKKD